MQEKVKKDERSFTRMIDLLEFRKEDVIILCKLVYFP